MANNKVTKFGLKAATPIETDLDGWKKVAGNPTMKTWIEYSADDGSSISGWWGATPGTYHATYAAPEFVHMIQGEIVITPDGGKPVTVKAGDREATVTWSVAETVSVLAEPSPPARIALPEQLVLGRERYGR